MDRIFTACHGTQLLVIQHLRLHLGLPPAREYLLWNPLDNAPTIDAFMRDVIAGAGFDDVLDIRDFEQLKPRTQGPAAWWFESARRLRHDERRLRSWLLGNRIDPQAVELWTDDPIHFNVVFPKACLRHALHVKFPHSFNLDDSGAGDYRRGLEDARRRVSWAKRMLFVPWLRAVSGCDLSAKRSMTYDVAYTFDRPSPWSERSIDVSRLISLRHFGDTFRSLPSTLKQDVESALAPIRTSRKPLLLLLLFGLSAPLRHAYQTALTRIYADAQRRFDGGTLVIKVHPGPNGGEEEELHAWARANLSAPVFAIRSPVNLELILDELRPDFVLAGPCGALPVLHRLRMGQPMVLPEIMDELCRAFPHDRRSYRQLVEGMPVC